MKATKNIDGSIQIVLKPAEAKELLRSLPKVPGNKSVNNFTVSDKLYSALYMMTR